MLCLTVNLFGTWWVTVDGDPVTGFRSDKMRAFFAYLVVDSDYRSDILAFMAQIAECASHDHADLHRCERCL
jgi:hypothetical protein